MRHEDERDADVTLQSLELDLHLLAELEVEGAERLVEQEDLGLDDQGSRQGDPLALAAGQLTGRRSPSVPSLTRSSASSASSRRRALATPRTRRPYATLSRTFM